jgi:Fe-S cluster assembly protein SufD
VLNGSLAQDALIIALPADAAVAQPLHLLHVSTASADTSSSNGGGGRTLNASAGRLLISLAGNAKLEVVEEFVSADAADGAHLAMPVAEVVLGEGAALKHGYVNREAQGAAHFKATLVTQVGSWLHALYTTAAAGYAGRNDCNILTIHQESKGRMAASSSS